VIEEIVAVVVRNPFGESNGSTDDAFVQCCVDAGVGATAVVGYL